LTTKSNVLWPDVSDLDGAQKAARQGVVAGLFVTGATTVFVILKLSDVSALVDAALFALIAWRIWKMSRTWAVIGLVLFAAEKAYWIYARGPKGLMMSVIILLGFVTSVRGTFAYARLEQVQSNPVAST
jgi:hypothetical protein